MLGRLATPPAARLWEAIRLDLVNAIVTAGAGGGMTPQGCAAAWATTATALAAAVQEEARAAIEAAAVHARYPAKRLAPLLPDAEQHDILLQRLLAAAIPLERLAAAPDGEATQRARGAALEAAWDDAVQIARAETARWRAVASRVAAWRRPWAPVIALGGVAVVLTVVLSAWLGGQLEAPGWFDPIATWFWGLPWL
jgi:hypothetical protein